MAKIFDVFLAYHKSDLQRAAALKNSLAYNGLRVWFDDVDIQPGELIAPAIEKGLGQSHLVLLIVSKGLLKGRWVRKEFEYILKLSGGEIERLIPVYYKNVKIPNFLANRQGVRFQEDGDDTGNLSKLIGGIEEFIGPRRESGQVNELVDGATVKESRFVGAESNPEGTANVSSDNSSSNASTPEKTEKKWLLASFLVVFGVVLGCATFVVLPYIFPPINEPDTAKLLFVYIPGCLASIGTIVLGFMTFISDSILSFITASSNYPKLKAKELNERFALEKKRIDSEINHADTRLNLDKKRARAEAMHETKKIELEKEKLEFEKKKYENEEKRRNNDRYFNPE